MKSELRDRSDCRDVRLIAFHLPQFHPDPRERSVVGEGLHGVDQRRQGPSLCFRGHHQPRLPADLGYYDLRLPEARVAQAELARRLRDRGLLLLALLVPRQALARTARQRDPGQRPSLISRSAWPGPTNRGREAGWETMRTRSWSSRHYSEHDDRRPCPVACEAFADPRYIRVHGRPLLVIYKPMALAGPTPDHRHVSRGMHAGSACPSPTWSASMLTATAPIFVDFGFDMTEHHEPQLGVSAPDVFMDAPLRSKFRRNLKRGILSSTLQDLLLRARPPELMAEVRPTFPHFPCCFVGWDNTARRGRARDRHGRLGPGSCFAVSSQHDQERPAQASRRARRLHQRLE